MPYTAAANRALALAWADADRARHPYLATEHVAIGLMREERGLAALALSRLQIPLDAVVRRFDAILSAEVHTGDVSDQRTPTSRVSLVLQLAAKEAVAESVSHIGTAHLLLALLREGEGVGAYVLADFGATLERVQAELTRLALSGVSEPGAEPPT